MNISQTGTANLSLESPPWLGSYPKNVNWMATFAAAPLYQLLDEASGKYGASTCTNFLGKHLTYNEIAALVSRAAKGLQALGVKKGTQVGLFLPNSPTFIVYYFAILKAGGTVVNYNPLYTVEELTYQVRDSQTNIMITLDLAVLFGKVEALLASEVLAKAVVCSFPALLPTPKSVLFKLFKSKELAHPEGSKERQKITLESTLLANDGDFQPVTIDPKEDIAVLQYTGGTTGTPKGAMLTHANVYINVKQVGAWCPDLEQGRERVLGALPFFHVFAMTVVMNFGIAKAAEIVIMPRFVLNDALKLIHKLKPTIMPGVPTLFNAIMNAPNLKSFDLSSLRFCLSGGAPLPLEVRTGFEKLTGCGLIEGYGLSEASPVVTANPMDAPARSGSIGLPLPATMVSLRNPSNSALEVLKDERGEICIKGPQVMKGYWNKPAETAEQFTPDGFLRTGDVAEIDADGYFYIVDRIKDLIICSGYNVYPRHIEEAIYQHPAVDEVTVIGIDNTYRGEVPKAFIKLKAGMTATSADIMHHLETKIAKYEMPEEIEFRETLPKTMIGKLSKKELKAEEKARRAKAK